MSANGKEYELAIRIAGTIDKSFNTSLTAASAQTKTFQSTLKSMDKDFKTLDKGFNSIAKVGREALSAIAAAATAAAGAVAAIGAASISAGSEFEDAFAGVKKTVDATEAEYEELRESILDMSREIPSSAAEIAEVMEIAGQLGIDNDSLLDFSETMINLGVSTNMDASEAADYLARFANVTSMADYDADGISNYEKLGSVVVDLGNNFATTETEIVEMATNLAATGDMVGLTEAQIMALATAMSSVGIQAEKGGSAMSKLLKYMQTAVETESDALSDYARVAGMTEKEFQAAFSDDAVGALAAFIEGLNDEERLGASAIVTLNEMGLTEVRLSDTILRLANAQGSMSDEEIEEAVADGLFEDSVVDASYSASLLGDALEVANAAWDENTALSIEAGKRYETFSSQVTLLKNAFTDMGIEIYDSLTRTPALEFIQSLTEAVNDFTDNKLDKWIDNINKKFPTLVRQAKNVWKAVSPFVEGLLEFGKWNLQNPEAIVGVVTGIASALAAYKTASTAVHTVNAINSLIQSIGALPVAGIMAAVTAIGALAGAFTAYKVAEADAVNDNLAEHFGDLSLSMSELEDIAEWLTGSEALDGINEALSAFDDLESVQNEIDSTLSALDKLNWKVSVGIELSEDEQETYKSEIAEYVDKVQEYALDNEYAVTLNLTAGISDDYEGKDNLITKVQEFYDNNYSELQELGTELNDAVTDAFNDGFLDIDEVETISKLQAQMAEIQEKLASSELEAKLMRIETDYSGASLDAETFQNLQAEIAEAEETAKESYNESYDKNVASIIAAYDNGNGTLSYDEYQAALTAANVSRMDQMAELESQILGFQVDTIMSAYGDEIGAVDAEIEKAIEKYTSEDYASKWTEDPEMMIEAIGSEVSLNVDSESAKAIAELYGELEEALESARELAAEYEILGEEVPEELSAVLENADLIGAATVYQNLTGEKNDTTSLYAVIAEYIKDDEDLSMVSDAVLDSYNQTQGLIDERYADGFDTQAEVRVALNSVLESGVSGMLSEYQSSYNATVGALQIPMTDVDSNATGGFIQNKELSWLAEDGPEVVIPLDGSTRAVSLWEQAGKILNVSNTSSTSDTSSIWNSKALTSSTLGIWNNAELTSSQALTNNEALTAWEQAEELLNMNSVLDEYQIESANTSDNSVTVEYSPTLQFYGDAPSEKDIEDALEISQDKFEAMMERYLKKRSRVAFG